jgi:hypothetical protein
VRGVGTKPGQHGLQALAILFAQGDEPHTQTNAAFYVADDCLDPDASLPNEEIEFGGHTLLDFKVRSLDEEAVDADV